MDDFNLASQHFEAANRLHQQGRLKEAEAGYRAVLALIPNHAAALHALGLVYIQTGRIAQAEDLLRRAAAAAPEDATIRNHLGLLLLRLGHPADAAAECEAALRFQPGFADALSNLGLAYGALGEHSKAIGFLDRAIALAPGDPEICKNLGEIHLRREDYDEALKCFERALAARPRMIAALQGRSEALAALGRQTEALTWIDKALAVDPHYATAHFARGTILKQLGRFAEAEEAFAQAVALSPTVAAYHRALGETRRYRDDDPRLANLEALAAQEEKLADMQKVELHFALFKAYDDLKRTADAFEHLQRGNAIYRRLVPYDEAAVFAFFRELKETFSPEVMRSKAGWGDPSQTPIFIAGMPRSGTTLAEQMLASHPAVFGAGELTLVQQLIAELLPDYPAEISNIPRERLREFGRYYGTQTAARAPAALRITDKLPANFRHLGLIHLALPNARLIHVRRDPRDTCFSCYTKLFRSGLNFAYDLRELGRYYRAYEDLMAHWRAVLPDGALLDVQYETLVENFAEEAKRIVVFCGLEWDERCLKFYESKRAVRTLSEFQVRQPLFTSSIGRWRPYEPWLTPLFETLR